VSEEKKPDNTKTSMLDKIKGLRGIFYKKTIDMMEKVEKEQLPSITVPSISLQKTHIVDFPEVKDQTKIDITYPLIEPFAYANVKWNPSTKEVEYLVLEPKLTPEEEKLFKTISDSVIELVDVGFMSIKNIDEAVPYLHNQVVKVVKDLGITMGEEQYTKIMYYIYKNFVGLNEIEPLMQDPNIEDISCDGVDTPIFVIHRKFGSIKTNISFKSIEDLREFVVKLSERSGRYVSYAEPILDGTLPDGSRVAATMAGDVATRGPTFTIRKFSEKPFSPADQIENKTIDPEMLAYFWYLVEHGASMLFVGGVATGKTSMLNTVSMFIPQEAKIVSIEDTREIRIPHEHWIAGLARSGFGIPTATGQKYGEVTLFDLLKESFRQNPDYVIVGEVRGAETYVMFQGMSSGHPSMSTFHAGSVESVIKRLTSPPIELSPSLIESLDVIILMIHARERGKSARRIKEVAEIISVDPKTQEVKTNVVYRWDPVSDTYVKVNESIKLEKFALAKGSTMADAVRDVQDRKMVLEWMGRMQKKDYVEAAKYVNMYSKEKKKLFELMGQTPGIIASSLQSRTSLTQKQSQVLINAPGLASPVSQTETSNTQPTSERLKKRTSILDLLGMKIIEEK
jgi:flagellar protein FlaI